MLPKISHPTYEFIVPSTKKKELFRPFLVKEEKMLLMAKTSEDSSEIFRTIKQIVNNCAISDKFDIDKLALFDLEYLFLKIRSVSVNSVVDVAYRDIEDNQIYEFKVDLSEIEVEFPENVDPKIKITDDTGIVMKYAPAAIFNDKEFFNSANEDHFFELILRCIDKIYSGEDVYRAEDHSREEIEDFLNQLDVKVFDQIREFMNKNPKLNHKLEYTNSMGNSRTIVMNSLNDFFTLG